ncbi:MAG: DUF1294 domain-containing protein [Defluviitaleaceae bacterium]|nr:DUF1294 domain-containing protein [Defluviitaleaceae bacterium]
MPNLSWILRFGVIELSAIILFATSLFTFLLYALDKAKAKKGQWRISEGVLIFFTLALGGFGAFFAMALLRHKTRRRKFKAATFVGLLIALVPLIHITHALTLDRIVRYREISFYAENWPQELDGFRIAFMTDFHIIPHEDMRDVASRLNQRNLDLVLLGGDFSAGNNHYQGTIAEIAQIITTHGIFGVSGNHDRDHQLAPIKQQHGIGLLSNSGVQVANGFYLAGVQDLWWGWGDPDVAMATASANPDDFILLISHNPDVVMLQPTANIGLTLAGHTHGGQITFFGYPLYLLFGNVSAYGTRFGAGFAHSDDGTPIFTSRGIGVYYHIPRIFSRPEVVIFTMHHGTQ